ncbi:unnamed protein product [Gadus morhua 'NCC']
MVILHNVWLNKVSVGNTDIVQDGTTCDHVRDKSGADLQCLKENGPPPRLHHPECPLNDISRPCVPTIVKDTHRVSDWYPVRGHYANWARQTRISTIPKDAPALRWVQGLIKDRTVPQHP